MRRRPARIGREDGGTMADVEKFIAVHGKTPTGHATTWGRHRERERSTTNSPMGFPMVEKEQRRRTAWQGDGGWWH